VGESEKESADHAIPATDIDTNDLAETAVIKMLRHYSRINLQAQTARYGWISC
jgi:hypothetical protein